MARGALAADGRDDHDLRPGVPRPVEQQRRGRAAATRRAAAPGRQRAELGALDVEREERSPRSSGDADIESSDFSRAGLRHHPIVCTPTSGPNRSTFRRLLGQHAVLQDGVGRVRGVEHQVGRGVVAARQPLDDIPRPNRRPSLAKLVEPDDLGVPGQPLARTSARVVGLRDERGEHEDGPSVAAVLRVQRQRRGGEHAHGVRAVRADDTDVAAGHGGQRNGGGPAVDVDALADERPRAAGGRAAS